MELVTVNIFVAIIATLGPKKSSTPKINDQITNKTILCNIK